MRCPSFWLFLSVVAVCAQSASAHHSFASVYDPTRNVTVNGVVTEFAFVNPHPYLVIEAARQSWRAELDNRFELAAIGIAATTFRPGDHVIVNGSPGRSAASNVFIWKLERPADGLLYEQVGSNPRVSWRASQRVTGSPPLQRCRSCSCPAASNDAVPCGTH